MNTRCSSAGTAGMLVAGSGGVGNAGLLTPSVLATRLALVTLSNRRLPLSLIATLVELATCRLR